jgi:hypothetical protein
MQLNKLKIKSVTELKSTKVHDLTVRDVQHYITENGVIHHNTGPEYAASIVLMLTKAQLKDGTEKVGIIVTAKPDKNRFAKPHPIKFHLDFTKGMNPYVGLEQYATWDICGITRGSIEKGVKTPKATARGWICQHLDEVVTNSEFFSEKVFTKEILEKINIHIKPLFNYNTESDNIDNEIGALLDEDLTNE